MATRSDISVDWSISPRIITVAAPSTDVTIQDLHDTLRDLEDEPHNLTYDSIISSAGKESLGSGVSVGLTATLNNARLKFEARHEYFTSGTTTTGTSGNNVVDSSATFVSSGVISGDIIENTNLDEHVEVLRVISETELIATSLNQGLSSWSVGDAYKIWHVIQCRVDGGNLVSVDENGDELDPIFPSSFTQVVRTSSSSATLQELQDIQYSSFNGRVWIDVLNGTSGSEYPQGTPRQPVNNLDDALTIAQTRGFETLHVNGNLTIDVGDNISLYDIEGSSTNKSVITFQPGSLCVGSEFYDCTLQGTMVSPSYFKNCQFNDVTGNTAGFAGTIRIENCYFNGTITLSPLLDGQIDIIDSYSGVSGLSTPIFDANGANVDVLVRNYSGGMEVRGWNNVTNNQMSIDMNSGNVIIDNSCTTGTIVIRGTSLLTDNSNGTVVLTSGLIFPNSIQLSSFSQFVYLDVNSGTSGTKYPQGTSSNPVNTLSDALAIVAERNISNIVLTGTLLVGPGEALDGIFIKGITPSTSIVVMSSGSTCLGTQFEDLTVTGVVDGHFIARGCGIQNVTNIGNDVLGSTITNCALLDSVSPCLQVRNDIINPKNILILNCSSYTISGSGPVIDFNGSNNSAIVTGHDGPLQISNWNQGQSGQFNFHSGNVTFDASCTNGNVRFDGVGEITDDGGGISIDFNSLQNPSNIADKTLRELIGDHALIDGSLADIVNKINSYSKLIPGTL